MFESKMSEPAPSLRRSAASWNFPFFAFLFPVCSVNLEYLSAMIGSPQIFPHFAYRSYTQYIKLVYSSTSVPGVFLQEIPHCASFPHHHFKGILKSVSHRNCLQQKRNVKITPEAKAQPSEKLNGQYLDFFLKKVDIVTLQKTPPRSIWSKIPFLAADYFG